MLKKAYIFKILWKQNMYKRKPSSDRKIIYFHLWNFSQYEARKNIFSTLYFHIWNETYIFSA